ncbi:MULTISPECIES: class I adenylate-forming enzyme family protein [unclassified Oceanobacillus]|uniref:class I adenylate-forming enzyme family protein n=1 Tax=unclassified Oceanobacillus TaxID=2630292 RepID=UPI00300E663D
MQQMLFSDPIKLNAIRYGEKEAISFMEKRFTYHQFNNRINQLGHALQHIGVKKGDKVAFMLMNCNQLFEIVFACSKIGAVFVPINSRFVGPEIKHVLDDSDSLVLIFDSRFSNEMMAISNEVRTTRHFISVGDAADITVFEYEAWISGFSNEEPVPSETLYELDRISIMYTGGTTGRPKGAVRTHRSLYLVALLFSIEFSIGRNGKGLASGPLYGAAAFSIALPNFFVGNPVHILEKFHPIEVLEAIEREKPTSTFLAPPMFEAIFSLPENIQNKYDVSSLQSIISVGAPLHTSTKNKIMKYFNTADLNEFYGATELGGATNLFPENQRDKNRSVGVPMLGMEVKLLDKAGNTVQSGEAGAFYVKGITLFEEYYNRPEATAESFKGEWLGLGDIGVQDEEGFYYIVDREQDMILSGAINVYPAEIEEVLHEHPKVADVAVIGLPHEKWGEIPIAIIVLGEGESANQEEIIDFCSGKLAKYKIPHRVDFVDELPRNLQGKLLKYQLREKYINNVTSE